MTRTLWLLLAIFVAPSVLMPRSPDASTIAAAGHLVFILAAALLFWSAAVAASSSIDKIYYQISIAMFIWSAAVVLRVLEPMLRQPAYGTIADAFWVVGYLVLIAGAYSWFRSAAPTRSQILWIVVILISAFSLIYYFFVSPLVEDSRRSDLLKSLDVFYLAGDLMILGFLSAPASKPGSPGSRLMLCGVLILLASDILFFHVATVPASPQYQYLDIPYTVADFLLALAGSTQRALLISSH